MKKKLTISLRSTGEEPPSAHFLVPAYISSHREYFNEGDEFLDDAIRTLDQTYKQVDGTLDVSLLRAQRSGNT